MHSFKDCIHSFQNKDIAATLAVNQKLVDFYQNTGFEVLKLGYILKNLANNCPHSFTRA